MRVKALALLLGLATVATVLLVAGGSPALGSKPDRIIKGIATGAIKDPTITSTKNGHTVVRPVPFLSNGVVDAAQQALGIVNGDDRLEGADATPDMKFSDVGSTKETLGCAKRGGKNVRVNQDCSFRRQAEEEITYNPADPKNLIAGQNDSRVGYNQCGIDWSTDNGNHWGDLLPPFRQHENAPQFDGPEPEQPEQQHVPGRPGNAAHLRRGERSGCRGRLAGERLLQLRRLRRVLERQRAVRDAVAGGREGRVLLQHAELDPGEPVEELPGRGGQPERALRDLRQELHRRRPSAAHRVASDRRQRLRHVDGVLLRCGRQLEGEPDLRLDVDRRCKDVVDAGGDQRQLERRSASSATCSTRRSGRTTATSTRAPTRS